MTGAAPVVRAKPRWKLRNPHAHGRAIPGYPPVLARVLAARGITTREEARRFYRPHEAPPYDPYLLPGMREAVARVKRALQERELIGLYGDFDVDGVTSLAVLSIGLRALGAHVTRYIPDRFQEGYGVNTAAIQRLRRRGVSLIITADCGITSVREVEFAATLGIDVIVLDHHTVPEVLPPAVANIDPKRSDSSYPFDELAAVGVAYRFLGALYDELGRELPEEELIDLVALGTVVDVAPLVDENRAIVAKGLAVMGRGLRPGLEALGAASGTRGAPNAEVFGFQWGPRLNAAGRIAHARLALDLLLCERPTQAASLADELDRLNRQRQELTEQALAAALEQLEERDPPLILAGGAGFHPGVVGIVAGRLAELFNRPAIVYAEEDGLARGSARSVPGFDVVRALRSASHLLVKFGGHRAAAGFTARVEDLGRLREALESYAAELLDGRDDRPVLYVDATASLADLRGKEVRGLLSFEPCGFGNEAPVLLSRGVRLQDARAVGSDGQHLRLRLRDGAATWEAIAFRQGQAELADEVDIVYTLAADAERDRVELRVLDIAPAAERRPLEA